jgi:lysophospholipase L1-like esterase
MAAELLALGDSYSSGQGVGTYEAGTTGHGNTCFRSDGAWPQVFAARLGLTPFPSLACSGARTPEIVTSDRRRREVERRVSQLARISGAPRIITITIGGNDAGFAEVLAHCVLERSCDRRYVTPTGDRVEEAIRRLGRELPGVYAAVQAAAPRARVIVVGYPRIFPRAAPGRESDNCAAGRRISNREGSYLNARARSLNIAIRRAAKQADVGFISVAGAFEGHELRCTGDSYVNRLRLRAGFPPYRPSSFHPTKQGHARLAAVVAARMRTLRRAAPRP